MRQSNPLRLFLLSLGELLPVGAAGTAGMVALSMGFIKFFGSAQKSGLDYETGSLVIYPVFIYCFILPFILTYKQFGHLHDKAQSDFYGSIPKSRAEIFTAKFSAVLTVQLLSAAAVYFTVNYLLWKNGMVLFGAGLRVAAAVLLLSVCLCAVAVIAISLCGRMPASAAVYSALTFTVPLLYSSIGNLYMDYRMWPFGILPSEFSPPFFYKIIGGILELDFSRGFRYYSENVYWRAVFPDSTLVWGAVSIPILSALAFLAYKHAKAHMCAGVRRPVIGHVTAAALTAPMCFRVTSVFIGKYLYYSSVRYREILAMLILALLIFLITEFLCGFSFKKLLRSLPVFVGVITAAAVTSISLKISADCYPKSSDSPEYIEIKYIASANDYYSSNISALKDIMGKIKINDSELISQLRHDMSAGKNSTYYILYELCSQNKSRSCFTFVNEEFIKMLAKSSQWEELRLLPQENVCEIMYRTTVISEDSFSGSTEHYAAKFGFIKNKNSVLDSFYREFSQLSEQQKLSALCESNSIKRLELRLKSGKVLKCCINSEYFPETESLLDNSAREELSRYGDPTIKYEIQ